MLWINDDDNGNDMKIKIIDSIKNDRKLII